MDKKIEKKKWIIRNKYLVIAGVIVSAIFIYQLAFADFSSKYRISAEKIAITEVKHDYFQDYISLTATVEPIKTVVLSAIEGGRVEEIFIEESNNVKKGDPILRLGNPGLILEISNNEAQVSRSINDLRMTRLNMEATKMNLKSNMLEVKYELIDKKRTYNINKLLFKKDLISRIDFEKSKEDYETCFEKLKIIKERKSTDSVFREIQVKTLETSVSRMQQNLKSVQKRVDNLLIKAPCDGELATLTPEIGQVVNYGASIGKVNVLDSYKLKVEVDEHYINRIRKGLVGKCNFANRDFEAIVKKVHTEVYEGKFYVDMIFTGDIPEEIRIGQTSRVKLELGKSKKALLVSRGAFYQSTGGRWIYVLNESNIAEKREIEIGRYNPQYYEIIGGVQQGERVITSGYDIFGESDKIVVQ